MWKLIKFELTYHRKLILWSYGLSAVLTKILIQAPPDNGDPSPELVFMTLGLMIPYIVIVAVSSSRSRNGHRPRLHGMLPVPLREVALSRVVTPLLASLVGLALAPVFFVVLPLLEKDVPTMSAFLTVNGLTLLCGQGLLLSEEGTVRRGKIHRLWHLWPLVLLIAFLVPFESENEALEVAWNHLVHSPFKLAAIYLTVPALAWLNVHLFTRRGDLTR